MPRRALYICIALAAGLGAGLWAYFEWWQPSHPPEQFDIYGSPVSAPIQPGHPVWLNLLVILGGLAVAITFVCLASSSNIYHVYYGKVIDRSYVPEHDENYTTGGYYAGSMNIDGVSIPTNWQPRRNRTRHVQAVYKLKLRRPEDDREGWVTVTAATYETPLHRSIDLRPRN